MWTHLHTLTQPYYVSLYSDAMGDLKDELMFFPGTSSSGFQKYHAFSRQLGVT